MASKGTTHVLICVRDKKPLKQQSWEMGSSDVHKGCHVNIESGSLERFQNKGHMQNLMLNIQKQCFCFVLGFVLYALLFCEFVLFLFVLLGFCFMFFCFVFFMFCLVILFCFAYFYMIKLLSSLCDWTTFIECRNW